MHGGGNMRRDGGNHTGDHSIADFGKPLPSFARISSAQAAAETTASLLTRQTESTDPDLSPSASTRFVFPTSMASIIKKPDPEVQHRQLSRVWAAGPVIQHHGAVIIKIDKASRDRMFAGMDPHGLVDMGAVPKPFQPCRTKTSGFIAVDPGQ